MSKLFGLVLIVSGLFLAPFGIGFILMIYGARLCTKSD